MTYRKLIAGNCVNMPEGQENKSDTESTHTAQEAYIDPQLEEALLNPPTPGHFIDVQAEDVGSWAEHMETEERPQDTVQIPPAEASHADIPKQPAHADETPTEANRKRSRSRRGRGSFAPTHAENLQEIKVSTFFPIFFWAFHRPNR